MFGCKKIRRSSLRRGFTLIELLIVITIISILAGLAAVVMADAATSAKIARTRTQVSRIHMLLIERVESYETRQLQINIPTGSSLANVTQYRLWGLRELMRAELPDRYSDIVNDTLDNFRPMQSGQPYPSVQRHYARAYARARAANPTYPSTTYEGAECLYLILDAMQTEFGTGLDSFKPTEIGDVDGDGMKEILDAWGNPIEFMRWPAGFQSALQPVVMADFAAGTPAAFQPDTFDPFRRDPRWDINTPNTPPFQPYLLVPLVMSAGPNKEYGLINSRDVTSPDPPTPAWNAVTYAPANVAIGYPYNDPYVYQEMPSGSGVYYQIGSPLPLGHVNYGSHIDNVDNHNGTMVP